MIPTEVIQAMEKDVTESITHLTKDHFSYDDHLALAELYYNRAEIRLAGKLFQSALEDFETCLMYDAYYYAAADRIEFIQGLTHRTTSTLEKYTSHRLAS